MKLILEIPDDTVKLTIFTNGHDKETLRATLHHAWCKVPEGIEEDGIKVGQFTACNAAELLKQHCIDRGWCEDCEFRLENDGGCIIDNPLCFWELERMKRNEKVGESKKLSLQKTNGERT